MKTKSKNSRLLFGNQTFERALRLLAHPASLFTVMVLLLNDHFLRRVWASWWTGKIGDVAWLFFMPFALAAVIAWLLPLRESARERWSFGLAYFLVGFVFIVLKVDSVANEMAMRIISRLTATRFHVVPDSSDLFALPALLLSFFLWKRQHCDFPPLSFRGLMILPLAALLTVANAGIPDSGITCLYADNDALFASSSYSTYTSYDGGKNWNLVEAFASNNCPEKNIVPGTWQELPNPKAGVVYRFSPGMNIQVATPGGIWKDEYVLSSISEAKELYYLKSRQEYVEFAPGPFDALFDPGSGNTLFAMGLQGVLLRTDSGEWEWKNVGSYHQLTQFPTLDSFGVLLGGMATLAAALTILFFSTLALQWAGGTIRLVIIILAWLAWLFIVSFFPPAQATGYNASISTLGMLGIFLLAVPLAIEQIIRLIRRAPKPLLRMVGFGFLSGALFLLPYFLWMYSTLPFLWWATLFSLANTVLLFVVAITSTIWQKKRAKSPNGS